MFYFEPPSRMQLIDKLHHLVRFSDFFLVLQGPQGSGKTTVLKRLLQDLKAETAAIAAISLPEGEYGAGQLLQQLAAKLKLEVAANAGSAQHLQALHAYARQRDELGEQLLLVLDDAQRLADDALELIFNLYAAGFSSLRILIAAEPELGERIRRAGFHESSDQRIHIQSLEGFTEEEVADFISQLGTDALSPKQLQQLVDTTQGLPGAIKTSLLQLERPKVRKLPEIPKVHLYGVGVVLLMVLAFMFWPSAGEEPDLASDSQRISLPLNLRPDTVAEKPAAQTSPVSSVIEQRLAQLEEERLLKPEPAPVVKPEPKPLAKPQPEPEPLVTQPQSGSVPEPVVASKPEVQPEPAVKPVSTPAPKPVAESEPKPVSVPAVVAKPEVEPSTSIASGETQPVKKSLAGRGAELLEWPSSGYTLQMLGARSLKTAQGFVKSRKNPARFYLFETHYKGAPWYVVIYGQYADRTDATQAVASLPSELRKLNPWARSIQGVQTDIKKVR